MPLPPVMQQILLLLLLNVSHKVVIPLHGTLAVSRISVTARLPRGYMSPWKISPVDFVLFRGNDVRKEGNVGITINVWST